MDVEKYTTTATKLSPQSTQLISTTKTHLPLDTSLLTHVTFLYYIIFTRKNPFQQQQLPQPQFLLTIILFIVKLPNLNNI